MKKAIRIVLALALAVLCLTAVAAAAGEAPASGICDVTVEAAFNGKVALEAQKADGTAVTTPATQEGKQVYADAVKVKLTYTGDSVDAAAQYLVLVLNDGTTVPTESNVAFIDQANGTITATIFPKTLENGKTYSVYLTTSSGTDTSVGMDNKVASFGYYAAYKLGDVDENGKITANDATCALQIAVGRGTWTDNQRLAANADKSADGKVSAQDAQWILEAAVGKRVL